MILTATTNGRRDLLAKDGVWPYLHILNHPTWGLHTTRTYVVAHGACQKFLRSVSDA